MTRDEALAMAEVTRFRSMDAMRRGEPVADVWADLLLSVEAATAKRCAEVVQQETYMSKIMADDDTGCEGCESGWCQMAVDAVCDNRNRVIVGIHAAFPEAT